MNLITLPKKQVPDLPVMCHLMPNYVDDNIISIDVVSVNGGIVTRIEKSGTYSENLKFLVKDTRTKTGYRIVTGKEGLRLESPVFEMEHEATNHADEIARTCESTVEGLMLSVEPIEVPLDFDFNPERQKQPSSTDDIPF